MHGRTRSISIFVSCIVICSNVVASPNRPADAAQRSWVALGDSYSSGEGVGNGLFIPSTNAHDRDQYFVINRRRLQSDQIVAVNTGYGYNECRRSDYTYSRLLDPSNVSARGRAGDLHSLPFDVKLHACSGAVASQVGKKSSHDKTIKIPEPSLYDVTKGPPAHTFEYQGPQLDFRDVPNADVVTLTAGGNDIGFGDLGLACVLAGQMIQLGRPRFVDLGLIFEPVRQVLGRLYDSAVAQGGIGCQSVLAALKKFDIVKRDPEVDLRTVQTKLRDLYRDVLNTNKSSGKLLVVGYPNVVSTAQTVPITTGSCPLAPNDRKYVKSVVDRLNTAVTQAVSAVNSESTAKGAPARITFVDQSHAFDGHELCGATAARGGALYENGVLDLANTLYNKVLGDGHLSVGKKSQDLTNSNSLHPTPGGYRAMAKRVMWAMEKVFADDGQLPVKADGRAIDTVLAIDSSGSMSGNDPSNLRLTAAEAYINAARRGEYAGVVDFDSTARTLLAMSPLPAKRREAADAIRRIDSSGGTNIGAAVAQSCSVLRASPSSNPTKAALLLTDGVGAYNGEVRCFVENGWKLYTIGFGSADDALLNEIAVATGGAYINVSAPSSARSTPSPDEGERDRQKRARVTKTDALSTLAATGVQDLPCEFQRIRSLLSGATPEPCRPIDVAPGSVATSALTVAERQEQVVFTATWIGEPVFLELIAPSGRLLDASDPDVVETLTPNAIVVTVQQPEAGAWTAKVRTSSAVSQRVVLNAASTSVPGSPPLAAATVSPRTGTGPLTVQFDGSASRDVDGALGWSFWDFGDGAGGSAAVTTQHTYQNPGTYRAQLLIIDGSGEIDSKSFDIEVAPVASPEAPPAAGPTSPPQGSTSVPPMLTTAPPVPGVGVVLRGSIPVTGAESVRLALFGGMLIVFGSELAAIPRLLRQRQTRGRRRRH